MPKLLKKRLFNLVFLTIFVSCNYIRVSGPKIPQYSIVVEWQDDLHTIPARIACLKDMPGDDSQSEILKIEECDGVVGARGKEFLDIFNFYENMTMQVEKCLNDPKKCESYIDAIPHRKRGSHDQSIDRPGSFITRIHEDSI